MPNELRILVLGLAGLGLAMSGCGSSGGGASEEPISSNSESAIESEPAEPGESASEPTLPDGWTQESHGKDAQPNYEVVFDQTQVKRLDIVIEPTDWEAMLADMTDMLGKLGSGGMFPGMPAEGGGIPMEMMPRNPMWAPCTVAFGGQTWPKVGVRFKGNSTLSQSWASGVLKLPMKLKFDELEDQYAAAADQRFYGFQALSLGSNAMDDSFLRDKVTGDLFRQAGIPTPWRAFYRIYLDVGEGPVYAGLYTVAEVPDRPMLETQFGDPSGNLYKPDSGAANWKAGLPIDDDSFEKENNQDAADWSDVERAVAALHAERTDAAVWRATLEKTFDVDGFLLWLAANTTVQDWDTYGRMAHNYYLYGDPQHGGRLRWIPWDHNLSMSSGSGPMAALPFDMSTVGVNWPLISLVLDDPVYRDAYYDHIQSFVESVLVVADVQARLQTEHDRIEPFVTGEEGETKPFTTLFRPEAFDTQLSGLLSHVQRRHDKALAVVMADERSALSKQGPQPAQKRSSRGTSRGPAAAVDALFRR